MFLLRLGSCDIWTATDSYSLYRQMVEEYHVSLSSCITSIL